MKIRGLIISVLGLGLLLCPELLDRLLRQKNDETTLRRKERIIGGVLDRKSVV